MKKVFDKINKILENKYFLALCITITTAFGMLYYYGILCGFMPSSEDYHLFFKRYANDVSGISQKFYYSLELFLTNELAYRIAGFSTKAYRLSCTFRYGIILCLTCIASMCVTKKKNIHFLPIIILFLVEIRGIMPGSDYGFYESEHNDILSSFPSNYHFAPLIGMLICLILIGLIYENKYGVIGKRVLYFLLILEIVYQFRVRDTIFFVIFMAPLLIYIFMYMAKEKKYRNYLWILFIIGLSIAVLTKFDVINGTHDLLWSSGTEYVYSSNIYGNTSWISLERVSKLFDSYIFMLSNLFNINRVGTTIASGWIIVLFVRVVLIIALFTIIFNTIKNHLRGDKNISPVDIICSYGFLLISLLKIFTMFNEDHGSDRYFFSIVPIACILLVRNFDEVLSEVFSLKKGIIESWRVLILILCMIAAMLSINNVWDSTIVDSNGESIDACIEYMNSVGEEGYAITPPHLYARMAVQDVGKLRFFISTKMHNQYRDENEKPRYVISNFDDEFFAYKFSIPENEEQLVEIFGEPVEIKSFGRIKIYRLW